MELDIKKLESGFSNIKVGKLSNNVIKLLKLNCKETNILLWEDRLGYIHKHLKDFRIRDSFYNCMSQIPNVIENPDYIAKHPTKNSLEYIKRIDELFIVVVRIKSKGNLAIRTAYPLTEEQLQNYIKSGTAIKINDNIDK